MATNYVLFLKANTKLTEDQLQRHLQSLVDHKILTIDGQSSKSANETADEDSYSQSSIGSTNQSFQSAQHQNETVYNLNKNFTNKRMKFKITVVQQKEVQQVLVCLPHWSNQ